MLPLKDDDSGEFLKEGGQADYQAGVGVAVAFLHGYRGSMSSTYLLSRSWLLLYSNTNLFFFVFLLLFFFFGCLISKKAFLV